MEDPEQRAVPPEDPGPQQRTGDGQGPPVQHCPFCGENVGSFWGRRGDDGSTWCESCQLFFRVQVTG